MRLASYEQGSGFRQRAFLGFTRAVGADLDDVGKSALRRPAFFGRPFLGFAQSLLRGRSAWSVGERELFAAVVSRANSCQFCVGTHGQIAAQELGSDVLERLEAGTLTPRAAATAAFLEALTREPEQLSPADADRVRGTGVSDDELAEAIYIAFMFNTINRVADALGFEHRTETSRKRGATILRRGGYRIPRFLMR
jgi:uncharacterized peroxidase-related enzyme